MIREAKKSDFDAIYKLEIQVADMHLSARPDIFKNPLWWSRNAENFEECLEDEYMKLFVFDDGGKILGHCKVDIYGPGEEDESDDTQHEVLVLFIETIFVDGAARGRGIGRQLLERAKAYGKEIGAVRLELCAWNLNQGVTAFYEHLGMAVQSAQMELIL